MRARERAVRADASVTDRAGAVCVVMVADCLPVLFCDEAGRAVGAAHAGWRGLAAGIVEKTAGRVAALAGASTSALHALPGSGDRALERSKSARMCSMRSCAAADATQRDATAAAFTATQAHGKYFADIYALARLRLAGADIEGTRVHGGTHCTVTENERFYSYRGTA